MTAQHMDTAFSRDAIKSSGTHAKHPITQDGDEIIKTPARFFILCDETSTCEV